MWTKKVIVFSVLFHVVLIGGIVMGPRIWSKLQALPTEEIKPEEVKAEEIPASTEAIVEASPATAAAERPELAHHEEPAAEPVKAAPVVEAPKSVAKTSVAHKIKIPKVAKVAKVKVHAPVASEKPKKEKIEPTVEVMNEDVTAATPEKTEAPASVPPVKKEEAQLAPPSKDVEAADPKTEAESAAVNAALSAEPIEPVKETAPPKPDVEVEKIPEANVAPTPAKVEPAQNAAVESPTKESVKENENVQATMSSEGTPSSPEPVAADETEKSDAPAATDAN